MEGLPDSIGSAREQARAFLAEAAQPVPTKAIEAVLLAVSELVTNAVLHAPGPLTLTLSLGDHCVRVAVTDTSPAAPVPRAPQFDGSGGLGLHMLEAIAGHVDTAAHVGGKTVSVDMTV